MSATLIKSVIVFIPAVMLLFGATLLFRKDRRASSLMQLLGEANWWFPSFLDRVVPHFHVEPEMELEPVPIRVDE